MRGGLFQEEPVNSPVSLRVSVARDCPQGCALILYALRDLGLQLWNVGSGGSIGRGFLRLESVTAVTPDKESITLRFDGNGLCTAEDPEGLAARWFEALREETK